MGRLSRVHTWKCLESCLLLYIHWEIINHSKNFFHTINLEKINFTMRQCIYTGGFVPSLFVILSPFVISGAFCKPSCRTLQFMSQFVTQSVKPKLVILCNLFCHAFQFMYLEIKMTKFNTFYKNWPHFLSE